MMGQKRQTKMARGILFLGGILFLCAAVYFLVYDVTMYAKQFGQRDWKETTATVTQVEKRRERSGRHGHRTDYDIYYRYEVEGQAYTGAILDVNAGKPVGETFPVKYDPEMPQTSTHYLKPTFGFVASGLIGAVVFGAIGYRMVRAPFPKKKKDGFPPTEGQGF